MQASTKKVMFLRLVFMEKTRGNGRKSIEKLTSLLCLYRLQAAYRPVECKQI
jgi:hypothetical protein